MTRWTRFCFAVADAIEKASIVLEDLAERVRSAAWR